MPRSTRVGDIAALVGSGLVAISLFLSWYTVNISALAMRQFAAIASGAFRGLFGSSLTLPSTLPSGPYSVSISALDKTAGGWRWAILIVSVVVVCELLLALAVRAAGTSELPWPHAGLLAVLTLGNLVMVIVAIFAKPISGIPPSVLTVSIAAGAALGAAGGAVAFLAAVAGLFTSPPVRR